VAPRFEGAYLTFLDMEPPADPASSPGATRPGARGQFDAPPPGRDDRRRAQPGTLGTRFAHALAVKDFARIGDLMHPEIDFGGMTPKRSWEAGDGDAVISDVLRRWFDDSDEIEALERLESDSFADRERVGYRLRVRNPDGEFVVEQQAYLAARDGQIGWMRVLCSGFRPTA
jgi:hypothetical protein